MFNVTLGGIAISGQERPNIDRKINGLSELEMLVSEYVKKQGECESFDIVLVPNRAAIKFGLV